MNEELRDFLNKKLDESRAAEPPPSPPKKSPLLEHLSSILLFVFGLLVLGLVVYVYSDQSSPTVDPSPQIVAKPKCGQVVNFTLSPDKPIKTLSVKDGTIVLGCNLFWQRGNGPMYQFKIDDGPWISSTYEQTHDNSQIPPVGDSLSFRLPEGSTGSVFVRVSMPPYQK